MSALNINIEELLKELDPAALQALEKLLAEDAPAVRKTIQNILDEPISEKVEKSLDKPLIPKTFQPTPPSRLKKISIKMQQAKERAEALRFLCMHLIKYLKKTIFMRISLNFSMKFLKKTDAFLGGERMFIDLTEEKLNDLCDLLANELLCFNN